MERGNVFDVVVLSRWVRALALLSRRQDWVINTPATPLVDAHPGG